MPGPASRARGLEIGGEAIDLALGGLAAQPRLLELVCTALLLGGGVLFGGLLALALEPSRAHQNLGTVLVDVGEVDTVRRQQQLACGSSAPRPVT
jgi:hypothetical protein